MHYSDINHSCQLANTHVKQAPLHIPPRKKLIIYSQLHDSSWAYSGIACCFGSKYLDWREWGRWDSGAELRDLLWDEWLLYWK